MCVQNRPYTLHIGTLAIGHQALTAGTSCVRTVAVGYQAGLALTSGKGNTFLGYQSGDAATTASGSVFLGASAGGTVDKSPSNTDKYNGSPSCTAESPVKKEEYGIKYIPFIKK